jgi:citrate synthase
MSRPPDVSAKGGLVTSIATSTETRIVVRGQDLVEDLIGHRSYTEMVYFLTCGRFPTPAETRVLDACLVTLMEHGLTPSALIARLVADSVPGQAQVAMAAGLLAVGDVFVGTMEGCARLLQQGAEAPDPAAFCRDEVAAHLAAKRPLPGFGHRLHKPDDPRSPRLFAVAAECGLAAAPIALRKQLGAELDRATGRHMTINATGAIGALLIGIGVPADAIRSLAVVSRAGGLPGHLVEDRRTHSGRRIWRMVDDTSEYRDPEQTG